MADSTSAAAAGSEQSKKATVRFGVYTQVGDFAGMTVAEARQKLTTQWGIPADAEAFNGKTKLAESDEIPSGAVIEYLRRLELPGALEWATAPDKTWLYAGITEYPTLLVE